MIRRIRLGCLQGVHATTTFFSENYAKTSIPYNFLRMQCHGALWARTLAVTLLLAPANPTPQTLNATPHLETLSQKPVIIFETHCP